jgi:hypothetical protein
VLIDEAVAILQHRQEASASVFSAGQLSAKAREQM